MLTNANLENLLLRETGDRWYNANQQTKVPLQVSFILLLVLREADFLRAWEWLRMSVHGVFSTAPAPFLFAVSSFIHNEKPVE